MSKTFTVDTNLFVRFLTNDSPDQAEAVVRLLDEVADSGDKLEVNAVTIAELVWVLSGKRYSFSRPDIHASLTAILQSPEIIVEHSDVVADAADHYLNHNIDWVDAYNGAWTLNQKRPAIYTFDRKHYKRIPNLTVNVPE